MKLIKSIIITIITIAILAWLLPTVDYSSNYITLILAAIILTILQKVIRPILKILLLPINIITLGLFSLVINVALLWLATFLVPGFQIDSMILMGMKLNKFFSLLTISFAISLLQRTIDIFI